MALEDFQIQVPLPERVLLLIWHVPCYVAPLLKTGLGFPPLAPYCADGHHFSKSMKIKDFFFQPVYELL